MNREDERVIELVGYAMLGCVIGCAVGGLMFYWLAKIT